MSRKLNREKISKNRGEQSTDIFLVLTKNASINILKDTAFHKTATLQPLTSHLTNHLSKTNKTCWAWGL